MCLRGMGFHNGLPHARKKRSILVPIGAIVMGQPEVYFLLKPDAIVGHGEIADESSRAFLKGYLNRFAKWTEVARQLK